jgi:hypothetical protein
VVVAFLAVAEVAEVAEVGNNQLAISCFFNTFRVTLILFRNILLYEKTFEVVNQTDCSFRATVDFSDIFIADIF